MLRTMLLLPWLPATAAAVDDDDDDDDDDNDNDNDVGETLSIPTLVYAFC